MARSRMHDDEITLDSDAVQRLVWTQLPDLAGKPISPVVSSGTDNALFRIGKELVARLPRTPRAEVQLRKEVEWLPRLTGCLPVEVPAPVATGAACSEFPWTWAVYRWIDGTPLSRLPSADMRAAAAALGRFVRSLRGLEASAGPAPGEHNFHRGVPLAARDAATRRAIRESAGLIDQAAALLAWEDALRAAAWDGPGVWVHGDLQPGNVLFRRRRLCAVIDFGGLGVGDPACDLLPAWNVFTGASRTEFRRAMAVDDATWTRGRGWALSVGLIALPYYRARSPVVAAAAMHTIRAALDDATA